MEIEIAHYLNRCSEGRLSNEGKLKIAAMLRIVSEIESIADCCLGAGKILIRKHQSHINFNGEIYSNLDTMFGYVESAMSNMVSLLSDMDNAREQEIITGYNREREINNFRNQLRTSNIENINEPLRISGRYLLHGSCGKPREDWRLYYQCGRRGA